ncbi:hypothetical protein MMC22_006896, partial [Lobaria immixta]|nr:hypothetical protein [Lobaria immixta]
MPPPLPQAPMIQETLAAPRPPVIRRVTSAQSQRSRKAKPMGKEADEELDFPPFDGENDPLDQ